ncbi:hypothetical protein [Caldisalinibacter kiritimatiensis]|uniref:Uncharacterized protein n=1 Tax=Caldisalinibacter kiritimatiensis TaxID=1304284 RepID=R1CRK1_9FIRM|nr:hypothetical protein [Caldisalinibacter kiritimatiensis]EOC99333.1 hypothetical protein L21TH_2591 [Caldisalinibacter kiritimatiensis]
MKNKSLRWGEIIKEIQNFEKFKRASNKNEHFKKVFIFTSIDLVNSTIFKQNNDKWVDIFSDFYGILKTEFPKEKNNINVWKNIGDEVLFYEEIYEIKDLLRVPSDIFKLMEKCQNIFYQRNSIAKNNLYFKATIWGAAVKSEYDTSEKNKDIENVMLGFEENLTDFIGMDIDEGFRLSEYTSQNKLVIDSKIAYLMNKYKDEVYHLCDYVVEDRIRIVGYRKLKGIWNNRLYPIIWYHKNWSNPQSMYLYDEHEMSDIVRELKEKEYKTQPVEKINKIFDEIGCKDKVKAMEDIIKSAKKENKFFPLKDEHLVELHFAVVCIDISTDKALIVKRQDRELLDQKWEFGCAKATKIKSIEESVIDEYYNDFNIKISLIKDEDRQQDIQPKPIAVYNIPKSPYLHKGVIFLGVFDGAKYSIKLTEKHKEHKFLFKDEINQFNEDAVPDFKDTLEKAFSLYEKYKNNL